MQYICVCVYIYAKFLCVCVYGCVCVYSFIEEQVPVLAMEYFLAEEFYRFSSSLTFRQTKKLRPREIHIVNKVIFLPEVFPMSLYLILFST